MLLALGLSFIPNARIDESLPLKNDGVFVSKNLDDNGPIFYPASFDNDISDEPYYSTQNSLTFTHMNYRNTSDYYRGDSVKVAVIDSGLNYTHEDFIRGGNQIIQGNSRAIDNSSGNWLYYQFSSGYQSKLNDTLGHGTNVASIIASQINNVGAAGIAPNIDLYVYKVTNTSNGYEWTAINSALQYCIDEGIDVVNMSFQAYEHEVTYNNSTMPASTGCSSVMTSMINKCYNAGITLVAAAGNYNTSEPSYPASNNHVISVGSLAKGGNNTKAAYSNTYGIDVVAPGSVYVADIGNNSAYKETQGTSFSAPIVTAAIALYKEKNPSATPSQIENALYASCDSLGNESWMGHGRLNIDKFLGIDAPNEIIVNNIEVVDETLELEVGDTFDLDWTVNGVGTFSDEVTFYPFEDNGTFSVDENGTITALSTGSDYLVIESTEDDSVYTSIYINVTNSVKLTSIEVSGYNSIVSYQSSYNPGNYVVTAHYSNGSSSIVTGQEVLTNNIDTSVLGTQYIHISYTEDDITKSLDLSVKITNNGASSNVGVSSLIEKTLTSTFTSASWGDSGNLWNSGKAGNQLTSGRGIQVTSGASGANGTTKASYSNVSSVVVTYSTNASKGAGSIDIQVASTSYTGNASVTTSGGTSDRTITYTNTSDLSGAVKITVTCTTNSIYIKSVTINYSTGVSYPASPNDQAKAWANYFLDSVKPNCQLSGEGSDIEAIEDNWDELNLEYGYMINASKTAFTSSEDSDVNEARTLYLLLINKYSLTDFVEDGNGAKITSLFNPLINNESDGDFILIISLSISFISAICLYVLLKKKEKNR